MTNRQIVGHKTNYHILLAAAFALALLMGVVLGWPTMMRAINLHRYAEIDAARARCDVKLASLGLPSVEQWTLPTLEALNDACHPEIAIEYDNEPLANVCMLGVQHHVGWEWYDVRHAGITACEKLFWYY